MNFKDFGHLICGDEIPSFLGIFDFSVAPNLLFYSYIPIVLLSAIISLFIFIKDKKSLQSRLLLWMVVFFILWVLNILVLWVASYHVILMFGWQMTIVFEVGLFLFAFYFAYVFLNKKDLGFLLKIILWIFGVGTIFLIPSKLNIISYDTENCEGVLGVVWNFIYSLEPVIIVLIAYLGLSAFRKNTDKIFRKQIFLFTIGIISFLSIFFLFNFYGELTKVYEFNLWGPVGMVVFLALLVYMMVEFEMFNVKLFTAQALVGGLVFFIGAQFFFIKSSTNFLLNGITFLIVLIFGRLLVRSVKKEISQKEELARVNADLQAILKQRESLVHLVTHKVKGAFTRSKYIFSGILEGMFGAVNTEVANRAKQGLDSDNAGIETVDLVLNAANLQRGTIRYEMENFDLKDVLLKVVTDKKLAIEEKGLALETEIDLGQEYLVNGDSFWLKEVLGNLVENAIRYTVSGTVTVGLEKNVSSTAEGKKESVVCYVRDTGIGITEEDKKNLFTEGGRGKDSVRVNVDSTGYGLYTVRLIMEAHKGRVWMEPNKKEGKGSVFFIELSAVAKN